jgi:predicted RNA binding protein YcfA (HicA-like mRNA interferase family)
MDKNKLLHIEKTSEFIKAIQSIGYTPRSLKSGSHIVYTCQGKNPITIVDGGHRTISIGVRRQIVKLIYS